jgi:IclR family acetate operon transcriptional repressor
MDIRSEVRVLNMFEAFAEARKPLSLTELAERIGIAPSTCHSLVKSVERSGYLYAAKARGALYPTRRIYDVAQQIMQNDLISPAIRARLERLRDETGESCCLAKRRDGDVVYLEVSESLQSIRFTVAVGETRPLHANSMGKAILASLPDAERAAIIAKLPYNKLSDKTLASATALEADIEQGRKRGWYSNFGETAIDALAAAMPVRIGGEWYGVSIVGPHYRMESVIVAHIKALRGAVNDIEAEVARAAP